MLDVVMLKYPKDPFQFFLKRYSMSIAGMKKKSFTLYGKSHVDKNGQFSLHGVHRQPPPTLGRSPNRTPFRGTTPMGHGCGSRCRVGGWRARICGSSYPIEVHQTLMVRPQTQLQRPSMTYVGHHEIARMGILHGTYPRTHVHKLNYESSTNTRMKKITCNVESDTSVHETGSCVPYKKEVGSLNYVDYVQTIMPCETIPELYKGNTC